MFEANDASIGIIGGADGPTAILVTGESPLPYIAGGLLIIAIVVGVIVFIKKRKK